MSSVAAFISPHGFGHAARCSAILDALRHRHPDLCMHLYTLVPEWFFTDSLGEGFRYASVRTDIGLVQKSPVEEDLPATLAELDDFLPFQEALVASLADRLMADGTRLVLCDIAPLGIAVARQANLPSILIENFTWDWIYRGYRDRPNALEPHIEYLSTLFAQADYRIQTRPVCDPRPSTLTTSPISRRPRLSVEEVRRRLGIPKDMPAVLLTMGGIPGHYGFLDRLSRNEHFYTIAPGTCDQGIVTEGHLIRMAHHSDFFHPDLVAAAELVVGKLGYSTVAEAFHGNKAFAWVGRPNFRESPILARFVTENMPSIELDQDDFVSGEWLEKAAVLARPCAPPASQPNGADQAADFLSGLLD